MARIRVNEKGWFGLNRQAVTFLSVIQLWSIIHHEVHEEHEVGLVFLFLRDLRVLRGIV